MQGLNLKINPLQLEVEWTNHPAMFGEWAEKLAEAQSILDEEKVASDKVFAEIAQDCRNNPSAFGIDKLTEAAVSSAVTLDPRMQVALKKLNAAKKTVGLCKSAVDALEHKKRAMTLLVELWVKDYYSELGMPKAEHLSESDKRAVRTRGRARRQEEADTERNS